MLSVQVYTAPYVCESVNIVTIFAHGGSSAVGCFSVARVLVWLWMLFPAGLGLHIICCGNII